MKVHLLLVRSVLLYKAAEDLLSSFCLPVHGAFCVGWFIPPRQPI